MPNTHTSAAHSAVTQQLPRRSGAVPILLCFAAIVFDGYDLVVYGAITPSLLSYAPWGLDPVGAGAIGSVALIGMFIGAVLVGYLTDVVGRRRVLIASVVFFSVMMGASALAPAPLVFGATRFLAGVGLGGVIPTAIAVTIEFSSPRRRNVNNALMFSGYAVGGVLASLLSIALLESIGFRGMLAIGALPLVTVVPALWMMLPESPAYLDARGRRDQAAEIRTIYGLVAGQGGGPVRPPVASAPQTSSEGRFRVLFSPRNGLALLLFCVAGIAGQTLVYGLTTWLPQLMVVAGYSAVSSLSFLLASNLGAVIGVIVSARIADRVGPRPVAIAAFAVAAFALLLLASGWFDHGILYAFVAGVGFGSVGTQILVNGFVGTFYDDRTRATALGMTLGVGRIGAVLAIYGGGVLISAELGDFANFAVWSLAAAVGIIAIACVPRTERSLIRSAAASMSE